MKIPALLVFILTLASARASFNEFECEFRTREGSAVVIEVERALGRSAYRDVVMTVSEDRGFKSYYYRVSPSYVFNDVRYWGDGFELNIDLWPDRDPWYGRSYQSRLINWDISRSGNQYNIQCRYTGF